MPPIVDTFERITSSVSFRFNRWRFGPKVSVIAHPGLTRLGTPYGGWTFVDVPQLAGCDAISCGLGEDASFDLEFAAKYGARVVIVDPTPRAIRHYREIEARIGLPRERPYVHGGREPADAYDLARLNKTQLRLVDKALTDTPGPVRFYAPKNPSHVSHSVTNYQNDHSTSTPYIEVEAVTIATLLESVDTNRLQLVKLDIEGAEITVIPQLLAQPVRPPQICVEFDELTVPSDRSRASFYQCHEQLLNAGYLVAYFDGGANFLYVQASLF